tara:strand:+ start:119 stop:355 length:237 start_codon:yes stop_codon:yes gene_type:complete
MKIIKGIFGFILFAGLTFVGGVLIAVYFDMNPLIGIFFLFLSIGMGRIGYLLFATSHFKNSKFINLPKIKNILYKKRK